MDSGSTGFTQGDHKSNEPEAIIEFKPILSLKQMTNFKLKQKQS